jgi:hypothetical protein
MGQPMAANLLKAGYAASSQVPLPLAGLLHNRLLAAAAKGPGDHDSRATSVQVSFEPCRYLSGASVDVTSASRRNCVSCGGGRDRRAQRYPARATERWKASSKTTEPLPRRMRMVGLGRHTAVTGTGGMKQRHGRDGGLDSSVAIVKLVDQNGPLRG